MENYRKPNVKPNVKSPSTEFSDEFVDIVNEINDFIAVLEARQKEFAEGSSKANSARNSKTDPCRRSDYTRTDSGAEFQSTESSVGDSKSGSRSNSLTSSRTDSLPDFGKTLDPPDCHPSIENEYEPIANILPSVGAIPIPKVTATATASVIPPSSSPGAFPSPFPSPGQRPELPPKPPGLQKMVEPGQQPKRVKGLHNFKGTNNDELCFCKNDIITVTQALDGGWWEGTLNGVTGWFPSNYVGEIKPEVTGSLKGGPTPVVAKPQEVPKHLRESMQYYHNVVLQNVIETERTHVTEMATVLQTYIRPIVTSNILSSTEFSDLTGNLEDIIAFQQNFLVSLEECSKHPAHQRRVGGVFMRHAPSTKELYIAYCANHPRAVAILQKNRDELSKFMETLGAPSPGSMTLTTNLSKPFTRLDKYPSLLKELERHIEESHVDRGDTQRAIAVYRDIAVACMDIRKLKEMEYEIITSTIKAWEGEDITSLGEVLHLSQVKVETQTGEKYERIFVLFPNVLLMLSMSPRLSGYQYEGKIPLTGMTVSLRDDDEIEKNCFEISGSMIENMAVTCGTRSEVISWLEALKHHVVHTQSSSSTKPVSLQVSTSQPTLSTLTPAKVATVSITNSICNFKVSKPWSTSCLRPSPPLRPPLLYRDDGIRSPRAGRKLGRRKPERTHSQDEYDYRWKRYDPRTNEEDALILKVIEAYCTSAKTRHTVNSSILYSPHVLIAEEEKIIVDADAGEPDTVQENPAPAPVRRPLGPTLFSPTKRPLPDPAEDSSSLSRSPTPGSLVDVVYSLRDQVKALEQEQRRMRREFEDEQRHRKSLENLVKKHFKDLKGQSSLQPSTDKEVEENHT